MKIKMAPNIIKVINVLILLIIGIVLAFFWNERKKEYEILNDQFKIEQTNGQLYKDLISYPIDVFEKKVKKGNLILAYIGNGECADCYTFYPELMYNVVKQDLKDKIIYVNGQYIRKNIDKWESFKSEYKFSQTPAFIIIDKNEIISKIEWDEKEGLSKETFSEWIHENQSLINLID